MINAAWTSRAAACCAAAALVLMLAIAGPAAAGKHSKSGKPKVAVLTTSQSALTDRGKLKVKIKSKRTLKTKLRVALKQGGDKTAIAKPKKLKVKKGKPVTAGFAISAKAEPLVRSCLGTHLHASITYKSKQGKSGSATRKAKKITVTDRAWRKRDPSQCDGRDPVGVEVDTADRCDPISAPGEQCLFPYPNDFYTRADSSTTTGLRLDLKEASMPTNAHDVHVDPTELNTSDGFSPGAPIVVRVPGMDSPEAFAQTDPVPITDMSHSFDPDQPIVVIDADTGERQLIWTELDSNASTPAETDLLIHFGKNLQDGHRYIVAMRGMKDSDGNPIDAPAGFQLFRDGIPTGIPAIENRRDHFEDVFDTLGDAGIARDDLYLAWDFTVASTENMTGRMLSMRDQAFADLGDNDLTDGGTAIGPDDGDSPQFTINPNDGDPSSPSDSEEYDPNGDGPNGIVNFPDATTPTDHGGENIREVTGTVKVPCYMTDPDGDGGPLNACDPGAVLKLDANGDPEQNGFYDARFTCNIPRSAVDPATGDVIAPVRTSMYGHGLFGDYTEVHTRDVRTLGTDHGVMTCATDFIGMSEDDVGPVAIPALLDMSHFKPLPDRLQQGFLDFLYLGRAMIHPDGFANDPAFQFNGDPVIDTDKPLFYYGNSQGGIAGGALTAVATDFTRSVLYVPGMNYSTLLTRSIDFEDYATILYPSYPDESDRPLLLSVIQSMWDRGEPDGYANHMTTDPLPNTPAHKVLIEMAYGDHQVANVTTEVEARTIGAPLRMPAVDADRLQPEYTKPFVGLETLGDLSDPSGPAANGSGYFIWDIGPKRDDPASADPEDVLGTDPPPLTNTAPNDSFGVDPHDTVIRQTPAIRAQIAAFLDEGGKITDPGAPDCGSHACYAAGWTGAP